MYIRAPFCRRSIHSKLTTYRITKEIKMNLSTSIILSITFVVFAKFASTQVVRPTVSLMGPYGTCNSSDPVRYRGDDKHCSIYYNCDSSSGQWERKYCSPCTEWDNECQTCEGAQYRRCNLADPNHSKKPPMFGACVPKTDKKAGDATNDRIYYECDYWAKQWVRQCCSSSDYYDKVGQRCISKNNFCPLPTQ